MCVKFQAPLQLLLIWAIIFFGYLHNFWKIGGGLPISPKCTNLKIFQQFLLQNENWKGVYNMLKTYTHKFGAPQCWPFWTNGGVCQFGPISIFFNNFLYKIRIERRSFSWKNCQLMYLGLHNWAILNKWADHPKMDQFWSFSTNSCTKSKFKEVI